ncbi:MAG: hypothetical protein IJZ29_02745 [Clostridia bacterium]|nr:hypothetical protein [Clostridia bacterium]
MAIKSITFSSTEPLTVENMNGLVQSSQIVQSIGTDTESIMSQSATKNYVENQISTTINNNINSAISTAIAGTIQDNINGGVNNIEYSNSAFSSFTTVKGALDYLFGIIQGQYTAPKIVTKEIDLVD